MELAFPFMPSVRLAGSKIILGRSAAIGEMQDRQLETLAVTERPPTLVRRILNAAGSPGKTLSDVGVAAKLKSTAGVFTKT